MGAQQQPQPRQNGGGGSWTSGRTDRLRQRPGDHHRSSDRQEQQEQLQRGREGQLCSTELPRSRTSAPARQTAGTPCAAGGKKKRCASAQSCPVEKGTKPGLGAS